MQTFNGIGTTIYGSARKQKLEGPARLKAEKAGYLPYSYQAVKWFVFLFLPIAPLGTFRVMKAKQGFLTTEFPRFAMTPVAQDWGQIARHYALAWGWIVALVVLALL